MQNEATVQSKYEYVKHLLESWIIALRQAELEIDFENKTASLGDTSELTIDKVWSTTEQWSDVDGTVVEYLYISFNVTDINVSDLIKFMTSPDVEEVTYRHALVGHAHILLQEHIVDVNDVPLYVWWMVDTTDTVPKMALQIRRDEYVE